MAIAHTTPARSASRTHTRARLVQRPRSRRSLREHLDALAGLNEVFAGSRRFTEVTVTLESEPSPVPVAPLLPRMSRAV